MNLSFWELDSYLKPADVVVVGAGIVGLTAAIEIKEQSPSMEVVVVDRGLLPMGASTRNAGFACIGSLSELASDEDAMGWDRLTELVALRWKGLQKLRDRIGDLAMDYEACGGYEWFFPEDTVRLENCLNILDRWNLFLRDLTGKEDVFQNRPGLLSRDGLGGKSLIANTVEGLLHPGKMMFRLQTLANAAGVRLLYGLRLDRWEQTKQGLVLSFEQGWKISAQYLCLATNGFAKQWFPHWDLQTVRNQVLVTQAIDGLSLRGGFHYDEGYLYFRNLGNRILIGGARNRDPETETTDTFGENPRLLDYLKAFLSEKILDGREVAVSHQWSGILGVGREKSPLIQWVEPKVCVAVRLGGMGVAIGSLVGQKAAQLIMDAD